VGPLSGAKLTLIASLIMAGCAQWWLARVMGFGRIARVWSGLLAIVGGQLAGRMELGVSGVVLSTAACSLVLAPGVALGLTGKHTYHFRYRPWDVWVGISLSLLGIILSLILWFRARQTIQPSDGAVPLQV
jgi:hypothetical protein